MRRRLLIGLAAAVALLLGLDGVCWYLATQRLATGFASWEAARRAEGWHVTAGSVARGGWPMAAQLTVPHFSLSGGELDIPGGLTWTAERLVLRVGVLHPRTLEAAAEGQQSIGPGAGPPVPYSVRSLKARIGLTIGGPSSGTEVTLQGLRTGAAGAAPGLRIETVRLSLVPASRPQGPVLDFTLNARGIALPSEGVWPLGAHIAAVDADGALDGRWLPPGVDLAARLRAWQQEGGRFDIQRFTLRWGPLHAAGAMAVGLDPALQPVGHGDARLTGYARALDSLAAHRVIGNDAALAAKAVLSLIAHAPADGGPAALEASFALRDRTLTVRGIPLLRLPELRWPGS